MLQFKVICLLAHVLWDKVYSTVHTTIVLEQCTVKFNMNKPSILYGGPILPIPLVHSDNFQYPLFFFFFRSVSETT